MRPLGAWLRRLAGVFAASARDRELATELDSHLAFHNVRQGRSTKVQ